MRNISELMSLGRVLNSEISFLNHNKKPFDAVTISVIAACLQEQLPGVLLHGKIIDLAQIQNQQGFPLGDGWVAHQQRQIDQVTVGYYVEAGEDNETSKPKFFISEEFLPRDEKGNPDAEKLSKLILYKGTNNELCMLSYKMPFKLIYVAHKKYEVMVETSDGELNVTIAPRKLTKNMEGERPFFHFENQQQTERFVPTSKKRKHRAKILTFTINEKTGTVFEAIDDSIYSRLTRTERKVVEEALNSLADAFLYIASGEDFIPVKPSLAENDDVQKEPEEDEGLEKEFARKSLYRRN